MKTKSLIVAVFLLFATMASFAQVLTFKVQTYNNGSTASRILAIWITNSSNVFVKTIYASNNHGYANDLVKWVASSKRNIVDATTAASSKYPTAPVTYTWNCTNVSKVLVPDGNYFVNIEFTEEQYGTNTKYAIYAFKIGQATTSTFTDQTNFKSVSYSTTVSAQTLPINEAKANVIYDICYQPNSKLLQVKYDTQIHSGVVAKVYDTKGQLVSQKSMPDGSSSLILNNLSKGAYLVKFTDSNGVIETKKFVAR